MGRLMAPTRPNALSMGGGGVKYIALLWAILAVLNFFEAILGFKIGNNLAGWAFTQAAVAQVVATIFIFIDFLGER